MSRMAQVPKSGLHNPLKNVDRYLKYGEISFKLGMEFEKPEVFFLEQFNTLIM